MNDPINCNTGPTASGSRLAIITSLLIAVFVYTHFVATVRAVPLTLPFEQFPDQLGTFSLADKQFFDPEIVSIAGMDQYIMWQYRDAAGYTLGLYIGYYTMQRKNGLIHSPKHCMPGIGWQPTEQQQVLINRMADGMKPRKINRMVMQKGLERQLVQFWYQGRGRIVASEYLDRAYMVLDSLLRRRSDGALVRITGPGDDMARDTAKQQQFITALMPVLEQFIPQ